MNREGLCYFSILSEQEMANIISFLLPHKLVLPVCLSAKRCCAAWPRPIKDFNKGFNFDFPFLEPKCLVSLIE